MNKELKNKIRLALDSKKDKQTIIIPHVPKIERETIPSSNGYNYGLFNRILRCMSNMFGGLEYNDMRVKSAYKQKDKIFDNVQMNIIDY
jgi:hypothetical protein